MDQGPLVNEEIVAGAELVRRFDKYEPVQVAFWLKASESPHRYLYMASERIDDKSRALAYGEVLRLVDQIRSPYLNPFRVKVVNVDDPLAKAAWEINQRFPGHEAIRFGERWFGDISADDVYIYPSALASEI